MAPSVVVANTTPAVINWQGSAFGTGKISKSAAASAPPSWMTDFVKNLGMNEAEHNPNAKINVLVPSAAMQVVSDAARRIGALFN